MPAKPPRPWEPTTTSSAPARFVDQCLCWMTANQLRLQADATDPQVVQRLIEQLLFELCDSRCGHAV